jgi:hypothetical protein
MAEDFRKSNSNVFLYIATLAVYKTIRHAAHRQFFSEERIKKEYPVHLEPYMVPQPPRSRDLGSPGRRWNLSECNRQGACKI